MRFKIEIKNPSASALQPKSSGMMVNIPFLKYFPKLLTMLLNSTILKFLFFFKKFSIWFEPSLECIEQTQ